MADATGMTVSTVIVNSGEITDSLPAESTATASIEISTSSVSALPSGIVKSSVPVVVHEPTLKTSFIVTYIESPTSNPVIVKVGVSSLVHSSESPNPESDVDFKMGRSV